MSIVLHVEDLNGANHQISPQPDQTLMEVLRDANLGVQAVCGGSCACATCHVIIDPEDNHLLPPAESSEQDLLNILEEPQPTSRLSCQIRISENLNNLRLTVAPEEE